MGTRATFGDRLRGASLDAIVLVAWIIVVAFLRPWPEWVPGAARALVWFGPILVMEPVSIRVFSRTPGQALVGLRVVSLSGRLGLLRLLARHLVKCLLGGLSLLYIPFSPRGQALHDLWFGTRVERSAQGAVPAQDAAQAATLGRSTEWRSLRRFVASLIWSAVAGLGAAVGAITLVIVALIVLGYSSDGRLVDEVLEVTGTLVFVVTGWRVLERGAAGRLPGTCMPYEHREASPPAPGAASQRRGVPPPIGPA